MPAPISAALLRRLSVGLLLASLTQSAVAQVWVTTLSEQGRVSINGMFIEKLNSGFKKKKDDYVLFESPKYTVKDKERWWGLTVDGSDRYAIRQDGRVSKNGERIGKLSFANLGKHHWKGVAVASNSLWSLRSDGRVSLDGFKAMDFAPGSHQFRRIASDGTNVYHLRTDGAVFRNDEPGSFYRLKGGGDDGGSVEKSWRSLGIDTLGARLYAVRADGKVVSAALDGSDPTGGVLEAALPFTNDLTEAKAYVDIAVREGGAWFAIRGRGEVHGSQSPQDVIVNLPGTPEKQSNLRYMGIAVTGPASFAALQRTGYLYTYDETTGVVAEVKLRKGRYRALAVSDDPPDLVGLPNRRPEVMRGTVTAVEGVPIEIPICAVDVDLPVGSPLVTINPDDLPAGASYDAAKGVIVWPDPGPVGKVSLPVTVTDGSSKPVRVKYKLRVRAADSSPKNRKPDVARVRRVTALARQPFSLPLVAVDVDGDALSLSVVPKTLPEGASFDPTVGRLEWIPTNAQIGRYKVRFQVDDGNAVTHRVVPIRVKASLKSW